MAPMERRRLALGILATLMVFGSGFLSARFLGGAPPPAPSPGTPLLVTDAGGPQILVETGKHMPKLLFDPDAISLLPDASLRLDLGPLYDDGGADPAPRDR